LGFPDTTQDADLFVDKSPANGAALIRALHELGFALSEPQADDIRRGKDFVQLKNGPFDLDMVFARDGLEHFDDAWKTWTPADPLQHSWIFLRFIELHAIPISSAAFFL
jgi:hypothetical protein